MYRLTKLIILSLLSGCLFLSCDVYDEDQVLQVQQPAGNNFSSKSLVTSPNAPLLIDIGAKFESSQPLSIKIIKNPSSGKLELLSGGLIKYQPDSGFVAGRDLFVYDVSVREKSVTQDTIGILMGSDTSAYDCTNFNGAKYDYFHFSYSDSSLLKLDVLANDWYCDFILDSASLTINSLPETGFVGVKDHQIHFIPENGFRGRTSFVYSVCFQGEQLYCSKALVEVDIKDPADSTGCELIVVNDAATMDVWQDSVLLADVLANDQYCSMNADNPLKIIQMPSAGQATITPDQKIHYTPDPGFDGQVQILYQVCTSAEKCATGQLIINVRTLSECKIKAENDQFIYVDSVDTEQVKTYQIDVLANDQLCNPDSVEMQLLNGPNNGNAYWESGKLVYQPYSYAIDSLHYVICDLSGCDTASVQMRIDHE